MTPEELLYKEAREALAKGEDAQARELFTRLLKLNRSNPEYWIWMSATVETKKERSYCLKEALNLDPDNVTAIRGLRLMGEDYIDPEPKIPIELLLNDWKTSLELAPPQKIATGGLNRKLAGIVLLGLVVIAAIVGGVILALQPKFYRDNSAIVRWSLTPSPSITATVQEMTPTPDTSGRLSVVLDKTFTPTPIYVATPHNLTEAYAAAIAAFTKGEWSKAADYFIQVLKVEPNAADIHFMLAETYRLQGLNSDAAAAYDTAIQMDPNFGPAYLGRGRMLLAANPPKLEEANTAFEKAVDLDPNLIEAMVELANASLAEGKAETALTWLDRYTGQDSETAQVQYLRAKAQFMLGETKNALASIEAARQLDRSYIPIYKLWGEILQADGQFEESIRYLVAYQENAPSDAAVDLLLAKGYAFMGDEEAAFAAVDAVIDADNRNVNAYVLRGELYMLQGEIELAEDDYDAALRFNRNSFDALIGKGRTQLAVTYAGSAYNYFLRAEDNAETDAQKAVVLYWRAATLMQLDEISAAVRDYETLLAMPSKVVPASMRATAMAEYRSIITSTPTSKPTETSTADLTVSGTPAITPTTSSTP